MVYLALVICCSQHDLPLLCTKLLGSPLGSSGCPQPTVPVLSLGLPEAKGGAGIPGVLPCDVSAAIKSQYEPEEPSEPEEEGLPEVVHKPARPPPKKGTTRKPTEIPETTASETKESKETPGSCGDPTVKVEPEQQGESGKPDKQGNSLVQGSKEENGVKGQPGKNGSTENPELPEFEGEGGLPGALKN